MRDFQSLLDAVQINALLDATIKDPHVWRPGTKMPTFYDPGSFDTSGPDVVLAWAEVRGQKPGAGGSELRLRSNSAPW